MNIIGSVSRVKLSVTAQNTYWWDRNLGQRSTFHNDSGSNHILGSSVFTGCLVKATISLHTARKPRCRAKSLKVYHLLFVHCLGSSEFFSTRNSRLSILITGFMQRFSKTWTWQHYKLFRSCTIIFILQDWSSSKYTSENCDSWCRYTILLFSEHEWKICYRWTFMIFSQISSTHYTFYWLL